ncbi:MAG: cbb3-type cytochrome c oxidase subunit I [Myxococcota bacterium]
MSADPAAPRSAAAEQPGLQATSIERRQAIDAACREPVLFFYASAVAWLLLGSVFALVASFKLHVPDLLTDAAWLTFGRVRPAHLNTMIYGWASMSGIGTLLWLQARLSRTPLPWRRVLVWLGVAWNAVVAAGTIAILAGQGTSVEWLEFPQGYAYALTGPFLVLAVVSMVTFQRRRVGHVYVSQWYLFGAVLWFPLLYFAANVLINGGVASGVIQATANWWFAHNVLGLWLTPIGLAAIYYLIPKVIGRPIHSYYLSLLGFWSLALFYNWAGTHHLIGGPVPVWVTTVGTVGSMMMFIPVITVAINHHLTMVGHFRQLRYSPTLRFIVFGGMSYTVVSVQGSLQALRSVNEVSHFTHYTVAHAHLGVYAFFTMSMFGAIYYVVPRLKNREWPSATLIRVHFWCTALGVGAYWVGLTVGGWLQGRQMNDPSIPFLDIVEMTKPYLLSRSLAGVLLTTGHVALAWLLWRMLTGRGEVAPGPTLLARGRGESAE